MTHDGLGAQSHWFEGRMARAHELPEGDRWISWFGPVPAARVMGAGRRVVVGRGDVTRWWGVGVAGREGHVRGFRLPSGRAASPASPDGDAVPPRLPAGLPLPGREPIVAAFGVVRPGPASGIETDRR
jgi:hypothetical protein